MIDDCDDHSDVDGNDDLCDNIQLMVENTISSVNLFLTNQNDTMHHCKPPLTFTRISSIQGFAITLNPSKEILVT